MSGLDSIRLSSVRSKLEIHKGIISESFLILSFAETCELTGQRPSSFDPLFYRHLSTEDHHTRLVLADLLWIVCS